jgi:hypothetical protein
MRALSRCILGVGLVAVATACGGGDDSEVGSGEAAGEAPQELSGELLSLDDLEGEWDTGGPEKIGASEGGNEVAAPCPDGASVSLRDAQRNLNASGNATISFESVAVDTLLVEDLYHDPTGELFEAFQETFDSCVGMEWEAGDDPVENLALETTDLAGHGDATAGYRLLWGSGGDYYGQDALALVRARDVLLVLSLTEESIDDPFDGDILPQALAAAVGHLEDGEQANAVDEPVAPEVHQPASVTVEMSELDGSHLVVKGNGGCRFLRRDNVSISITKEEELDDPEEDPDFDLSPNVEWLAEQAFAVHPSVSVQVFADHVNVSLYEETDYGDSIGYRPVDRETAERAADKLRKRLGNRSVCGSES